MLKGLNMACRQTAEGRCLARSLLLWWALSALCPLAAQELPPVRSFKPEAYLGGNQNWMIGQGQDRFLYVANNAGLLEFNGTAWTLYPSPNETIIRAVRPAGGRIYTGCYMEFGYWERGAKGQLSYHSVSAENQDALVPDEHIWNILEYEGRIVFQSLDQLYIYTPGTGSMEVIRPEHGVDKLFLTDGRLIFTDPRQAVFELIKGEQHLLIPPGALPSTRWIDIRSEGGQLFLLDANEGVQGWPSLAAPVWSEAAVALEGKSIYSARHLSGGQLAVGTISNGVFLFGPKGQLRYHFSQSEGLANNTVLSLFEDDEHNLWAGTDNGINCINLESPIRRFADESGRLGTVYAAEVHNGQLYLGTNQGLFRRAVGGQAPFRLIPGTKGQVWALYRFGGDLLCGHDKGVFLLEGEVARKIGPEVGAWKFEPAPAGSGRIMAVGTYRGLVFLEKNGGSWAYRNSLEGFDYSARFFEWQSPTELVVSHEYKGVFGIRIDKAYQRAVEVKTYPEPRKGKHSSLERFDGDILYCSRDGVFRMQDWEAGFVRDSSLSVPIQQGNYHSGKMVADAAGRLWLFTRQYINYFSNSSLLPTPKLHQIPIASSLINAMPGYENIATLQSGQLLIGTADGYLLLNLGALSPSAYQLILTEVSANTLDKAPVRLLLQPGQEVPYGLNSLSFGFAVPAFQKYDLPEFQYQLEGYVGWSEWSGEAQAQFKNLPFGQYTLRVRSRLGGGKPAAELSFPFIISRPWYWSYPALGCYLVFLSLLAFFTHRAYTGYYKRQQAQLQKEAQKQLEGQQKENELQLVRLRNEQLQKDIENKNRELAISTMSLVKKNELLNQIKDELKASEDANRNIRAVVKTINRNTNEEDTWNLFKEAFENADQEFFKKIKERHPALTPNDLKLCAYLRLNLSSKEIAPLLNISVRSVEVKRYRLRKKMELEHDEGLVEYILGI